jgi:hypothetical protein
MQVNANLNLSSSTNLAPLDKWTDPPSKRLGLADPAKPVHYQRVRDGVVHLFSRSETSGQGGSDVEVRWWSSSPQEPTTQDLGRVP